MTTTWSVVCKDCGRSKVEYSDSTRRAALERGQSPPERCSACRLEHRRQTSRLGLAYVDLEPGRPVPPLGVKASRLGRIERKARPHLDRHVEPEPIDDDQFGIKDPHVVELLEGLVDHQVAIVQAGTGSGKSTFLPYRLLVPPPPFEQDHLTRHGQIVVTQPRIDASTGIPTYVARRLHGSTAGQGMDIGYRNSKATDKSDAANKLVYLTDGTLVNMIRKGELHTLSTIVIDEAHERSLNIDLILALLRREMRNYPQLRLLIVSATLDESTFTEFFAPDYDVLSCPMPSKLIHPVHDRWRATVPLPMPSWPRLMPAEVAATAIEVLRWMELGERPTDIPTDVPAYEGDILCFLPGKRPIAQAIEKIEEQLAEDDDLKGLVGRVEVLPLFSELPAKLRRRPLDPKTRKKTTKYRIVVSTNLAETSLTIDGIRHVIDSGLNNLTSWDPYTAAPEMRAEPHSRSGLLQRRGRAGRNAPGVWHCLFTKPQFDALAYETAPEIARAPLSAVLLNAAASGVSDPTALVWMRPGPHAAELTRVRAELLALGAINEHGDPTELGREMNATRGEFSDTTLLINADIAGCVVEAATVLAMKGQGLSAGALLKWARTWPAEAKVHVDDVHTSLLDGCPDDLEAVCRIVSYWEQQDGNAARATWCERHYIDGAVLEMVFEERARLLIALQSRMKTEQLRSIDLRLLPRLRAVIAWSHPNGIYEAELNDGRLRLRAILTARSDVEVVAAMQQGPGPIVDQRSWAYRRAPKHLVLLDRTRASHFTSPLVAPVTIQQGSLCAAVDPTVLDRADTLLGVLATTPLGATSTPPSLVPGDRLRVWGDGWYGKSMEVLEPAPDPTVDLGADDDFADDVEDDGAGFASIGIDDLEGPVDGYIEIDEEDDERLDGLEPRQGGTGVPPAPMVDLMLDQCVTEPGAFNARVTGVRDGQALAQLEPEEGDFDRFTATHAVGATFVAIVDEVRLFPRDNRPLIVAHDESSRTMVVLDGAMLGTGLRYSQAALLTRGAAIRLAVDGYDWGRCVRYISQTAPTIAALTELRSRLPDRQRSIVANAELIEADDRTLWVQLVPDALSGLRGDAPPLVLSVESARLPSMPGLAVGLTTRVRLTWKKQHRRAEVVRGLAEMARLPDGPWELQGESVVMTDAPTVADWERIVRYAQNELAAAPDVAARLRSAVLWSARRMLTPRVAVIDQDAIEQMQAAGYTDATVLDVDEQRVVVGLPHGGVQTIFTDALTWGSAPPPSYSVGDTVTAFITHADPTSGDVRAQLRDPASSPFLRLEIGDVHHADVVGRHPRDERDLVVRLRGVDVDARLLGRDARDVEVGDRVRVRITQVDRERHYADVSTWLVDETIELPGRLAELWTGPAGAPPRRAALERVVPEAVQLRVLATDTGLAVRVLATDMDDGQSGVVRLQELARSEVRYIGIPFTDPIRADDYALLRELAPDVAAAMIRRPSRDRQVSALVVVAEWNRAFESALATVQRAFPQQWATTPFFYRREMMNPARDELRASDIDVRLAIEPGSPPRVLLGGAGTEIGRAIDLLRRHGVAVPEDGSWQPDKRIVWID